LEGTADSYYGPHGDGWMTAKHTHQPHISKWKKEQTREYWSSTFLRGCLSLAIGARKRDDKTCTLISQIRLARSGRTCDR